MLVLIVVFIAESLLCGITTAEPAQPTIDPSPPTGPTALLGLSLPPDPPHELSVPEPPPLPSMHLSSGSAMRNLFPVLIDDNPYDQRRALYSAPFPDDPRDPVSVLESHQPPASVYIQYPFPGRTDHNSDDQLGALHRALPYLPESASAPESHPLPHPPTWDSTHKASHLPLALDQHRGSYLLNNVGDRMFYDDPFPVENPFPMNLGRVSSCSLLYASSSDTFSYGFAAPVNHDTASVDAWLDGEIPYQIDRQESSVSFYNNDEPYGDSYRASDFFRPSEQANLGNGFDGVARYYMNWSND